MILQRLARSIHGRDWFTVLIEVLIVVAGILIGLQVNNWNESRKSAAWEQRFLTDLAIEFQTNREQLWQVHELQKQRGSALDEVREQALHGKDARVLADVEKYYSLKMSSNRTFFPTKGVTYPPCLPVQLMRCVTQICDTPS